VVKIHWVIRQTEDKSYRAGICGHFALSTHRSVLLFSVLESYVVCERNMNWVYYPIEMGSNCELYWSKIFFSIVYCTFLLSWEDFNGLTCWSKLGCDYYMWFLLFSCMLNLERNQCLLDVKILHPYPLSSMVHILQVANHSW
jgi:hypothetical protein